MAGGYALFTGCFIQTQLPYLEKASVEVLKTLGVKPEYLEFSCCPNPRVRSVDEGSWLNIAARNLALAQKADRDIITLCSDCYGTLKTAKHMLEDELKRQGVNDKLKKIGLEYTGSVEVRHITELILEYREEIAGKIRFPVKLSLSVHDGCRIHRPERIMKYDPRAMDDLLGLVGCEVIPYPSRNLCCGSPAATVNQTVSDEIARLKLREINDIGADALCTGCPLCFMQYDRIQESLKGSTPIFYYPELLAIAIGVHPRKVGVQYHRTNTEGVIKKCLRS